MYTNVHVLTGCNFVYCGNYMTKIMFPFRYLQNILFFVPKICTFQIFVVLLHSNWCAIVMADDTNSYF